MPYAKLLTKKPIGFKTNASLFRIKPAIDYRTHDLALSGSQVKAGRQQTQFVVISPGQSGPVKVFAADEHGRCVSWLAIGEPFPDGTGPAAILKALGYTLN